MRAFPATRPARIIWIVAVVFLLLLTFWLLFSALGSGSSSGGSGNVLTTQK
jgi:hypothetical protein